jgi:hypothetical protein
MWSDARRSASIVTTPPAAATSAPALAPVPPRPNALALVGFILALSGVVVPFALNALAGGIVSAVALRRSKRLATDGVLFTGHGFALAGVLIGFIWGALSLLVLGAIIAFWIWIVAVGNNVQFPDSPVI